MISGQLTHNDNRCCVATNLLYLKSPTLSLIFASKVRAVLRDAFGLDQVTLESLTVRHYHADAEEYMFKRPRTTLHHVTKDYAASCH